VNPKASTTAEDLIEITNNGEEPVDVWIATQGGAQADNTSINTSFYISSEHINSSNAGEGDVAPSEVTSSPDPKPLRDDISTHTAFVDGNGETTADSDAVISEVESDEDQSPDEASAVTVAPGDSIRVSFAVEIDGEANTLTNNNDTPILSNIVIFAVNDDEDGSTTIDQQLATSPGSSDETPA
jgi:hypothetical protein